MFNFDVSNYAHAKLLESEKRTISIYENTVHSVVNISNIQVKRGFFFDAVEVPAGAGSGFIWDNKGHIITNFHVADNGSKFLISFHNNKKQYEAKFIGGEKTKDIAVLKLLEIPPELRSIALGKSSTLKVGQMSIAIGNPFGLDHSMSKGIISALGRKIRGYGGMKIHNMIQTDTSINQGNSGGPLLDSSGKLIGINTMIYSTSGSSAGLGFAVPVDTIARIVPQIIKHGRVIRPALGITILPDNIKKRFVGSKGIAISTVQDDGAAADAGLQGMKEDQHGRVYIGDVILKVAGVEVNEHEEIYHQLESFKIGDTVPITFERNNKIKQTKITLQELKDF
jgi:S1-C subfamily serine protease